MQDDHKEEEKKEDTPSEDKKQALLAEFMTDSIIQLLTDIFNSV